MNTLYEITADMAELQDAILENGGELTPEMEMRLDQLAGEVLPEKVDGYCRIIAEFDGEADMLKAEIDRLSAKVTARVNASDRLRKNLMAAFERIGETKIKTALFSVSVCKNSMPSVAVDDATTLPPTYQRIKIEADKIALVKDWKAGEAMPNGVVVEQKYHLRIK